MSGECTIIISNEDIDFILDLLKNPPKPNQKLKDAFKFYHLKKSENMSGECDKCGEHALECRCYEKCKCNKHPETHPNDFEMLFSEFGMLDKILLEEIHATCKVCREEFTFTKENTENIKQYFNTSH